MLAALAAGTICVDAQVFELQIGLFGVIMLLFLILEPRGLAGIWMRVRAYFQLWPFKYRTWES